MFHDVAYEYYSLHAIPPFCGAVATVSKSKLHCTRAQNGSYQALTKQIGAHMWLRTHDLNTNAN